jgi:hypothetical protein
MNEDHNPTLRMHGPVDLLSAIPYLLGFTPEQSLVLIGLTHGVLVVTARLDLAKAVEEERYIAETLAAMVRGGSSQFIAAIFTDTVRPKDEGMPYAALAATVDNLIEKAESHLLDALLVNDAVWSSYSCTDRQCCRVSSKQMPNAPTPRR